MGRAMVSSTAFRSAGGVSRFPPLKGYVNCGDRSKKVPFVFPLLVADLPVFSTSRTNCAPIRG